MKEQNLTLVEKFLIVGFSDFPQIKVILFIAFLLIYLFTLTGNLLIVTAICCSSQLHSPMYFFLTNLALIDITYTSILFPPMLARFFLNGTFISLTECLLQMHFFVGIVSTEFLFLTIMAYDRYVAICHPLRYLTIMNRAVCIGLTAGCWLVGLIDPTPHTVLMSKLSFCATHTINHFFCDVTALMKISCSSTHALETQTYILGATVAVMSFILVITSYVNIISAVLKIKSTEGRRKAFSTCASHFTVVVLFYGSICSTYMRPTSAYSMKDNKILSLTYTALTPLCNPIIYSLKNRELKNVLMKNSG
ncbi:olfactory receptor 5V1-like [Lissotriton helveticus]